MMDCPNQSGEAFFSAAEAYWRQRIKLAESKQRLELFQRVIEDAISLSGYQYAQLLAASLEFQPDFILELGRYRGNSTCAFVEAANLLGLGEGRVLSLDIQNQWKDWTLPRLRAVLPISWFTPLRALQQDILTFDFRSALATARRPLLFWDAHGFEIAECVLGAVLPEFAPRPHLVIMHDLSDSRYTAPGSFSYGGQRLWKGVDNSGPRLKLGMIDSAVGQSVSILDFATRNRVPLHSAEHSFHTELAGDADRVAELQEMLGSLFSLEGHWFYFSLSEASGPLTFPAFRPLDRGFSSFAHRTLAALHVLLGR
jgi:hypothetical protein